ncbi:MAG TPA: sugar transferase [Candidatus Acidoferrales bacterium]|nr:sugar transferase [Candidatus Acidoferrales bacterium]
MGTKLAEMQRAEATLDSVALRARASAHALLLSNLLKKSAVARVISLSADAVSLVAAHWGAAALVVHWIGVSSLELNPRYYAVFYLPFLLGVLFVFERNQRPELRRPEKELELTVKGVSLAFLLLVCANFVVFKTGFSRYLMVSWYLLALFTLLVARYGVRIGYAWLWSREIGRRRTLLVGSEEKLFELQTLLSIQRYRGYDLLGIVPAGDNLTQRVQSWGPPMLGTLDRWHEAALECDAEQVIVALDESTPAAHRLVSRILKRCLADGVDVQVYSDLFASRAFNYELDEFSGFFRFFAAPQWSKQIQIVAKKILDFVAGAAGSLITLLALPIIALLIKMEDGGPVFYQRELLGRGGEPRLCRKFRTMCVDAREILERDSSLKAKFEEKHKLVDDPRVTRIGRVLRKYSIDELPEFFMVLCGKLSLVGPRAISRGEANRYGEYLSKLTSVKPGMTGFWQVMGRQLTTYEERIQMDMFYIDHWSVWLDIWIVCKTFWKVLRAEGAY